MSIFRNSLLIASFFLCCGFSINLQNSSLSEFVQWYAEYTHTNVVLDSTIDKTLTVYAHSVDEADVHDFFRVVLQNSGLSVVNEGGFVSVRQGGAAPVSGNTNLAALRNDIIVASANPVKLDTLIVSFKNRSAAALVPLFESYLGSCSGGGSCPVTVSLLPGNRIFLRGDADLIGLCRDLAFDLDLAVARYVVEAVIVENLIDQDSARGVEFAGGNVSGFGRVLAGSVLNVATGGLSAVIDHADLSVVLRFFDSDSHYKILSTPSVILSDNETARLFVGSNIPVITGESTSAASSTDSPFRTIERRDVGLEINVSVASLSSDLVRLNTNISASSVSDTSIAGVVDVVTNQRELKTAFDTQLGHVVGIGGLVSTDVSDQVNSVPFLSDIPLVGGLFESKTHSLSKRNLSVFLSVRSI